MKPCVSPLSERIAQTAPLIDVRSPRDYLDRVLRPQLLAAIDEGKLEIGAHAISKCLVIHDKSKVLDGAADLVGGRRNNQRSPELADLRTPGGGWLFFAAVMRAVEGGCEIVAYNIERVYGPECDPCWVRFDLSPPGHDNDERGMGSHFHPSNDDLQLPAPIFAPHELIEFLLEPLAPSDGRKPRSTRG